jgi:hypothetical protein
VPAAGGGGFQCAIRKGASCSEGRKEGREGKGREGKGGRKEGKGREGKEGKEGRKEVRKGE